MANQTRVIKIYTRWDAKQTGPREIEIHIPIGGTVPVLHPPFVDLERLSDAELDTAALAALTAIAIIK